MIALQKFLNHFDKLVRVAVVHYALLLHFAKRLRQFEVHHSNVFGDSAVLVALQLAPGPLATVRLRPEMRPLVYLQRIVRHK